MTTVVEQDLKVLEGNESKKGQGSWVYTDQGVAEEQGFKHVSKLWYPKTISYDEGIEQIEVARKSREDLVFDANSVEFQTNGKDVFAKIDGREYKPSQWSARQLCNWYSIPQTIWTYYMNGSQDEGDISVVLKAFNNGKRKYAPSGQRWLENGVNRYWLRPYDT